jgi:hypothetical protein
MTADLVDRTDAEGQGLSPTVARVMPAKLIAVIGMVRAKLRDYPELNRLVSGQETSDRQIAMAMVEAIDDYNTSPPLIDGVTLDTYPSVSLLVNGTIIYTLQSIGLLQTRNMMNYSDGQGVQTGVNDKTPMLLQWIQLFTQQYEAKKLRLKKAINLNGALNGGGVPSEYSIINGYFDSLE